MELLGRHLLAWAAVALLLGCVPGQLLNSERIELEFGSYGIEVLESSDSLRVSNLYSLHDGQKVCRTFAVVRYPDVIDSSFAAEHRRIVAGQSIGSVFKGSGWSIEKKHRYFGVMPVRPEHKRVKTLMGALSADRLAVHVYVLVVKRSGLSFDYATIAEVHHPDYLSIDDLRAIYGRDVTAHANADREMRQFLDVVDQRAR